MESIKLEMQKWIQEISLNNKKCEIKLREIITSDKELIKSIKGLYDKGDSENIKKIILEYKLRLKIEFIDCIFCGEQNFITVNDKFEKCSNCGITINREEFAAYSNRNKCMYCTNLASPNSRTCYEHKRVPFYL